jgi:hypothetical protein
MIAAAQLRYRVDEAPPINMVGILVVADQFTFVTATITKEYLECLSEKATPPTLEFHWWPAETASKYPHQGQQGNHCEDFMSFATKILASV